MEYLEHLCSPEPAATIDDNDVLSRGQGCWLGQLCGDALGSMVEFQSPETITRQYGDGPREIAGSPIWNTVAGQPTDDSEMALLLARTILQDRTFRRESAARAYMWWRNSRPFDIGGTIHQATNAMLEAARSGTDPVEAAHRHANRESEANGALMRQSPLGLWGWNQEAERVEMAAREDARLTHPNPVCLDASAVYAVTLAAVIREGLDGDAAHTFALDWARAHAPSVVDTLEAARTMQPDYLYHAGWVRVALQNAFYQARHAPSFAEGVIDTVRHGGDSDTNAAIAGALLGAIHGAPAVPRQWTLAVLTCRPLDGATGVREPRPMALWPVDALILAERIMALP